VRILTEIRAGSDAAGIDARSGNGGLGRSVARQRVIVRGLGNEDALCSCSHGAGRVMSRTRARKDISLEQHLEATAHVECRKDSDVTCSIDCSARLDGRRSIRHYAADGFGPGVGEIWSLSELANGPSNRVHRQGFQHEVK
jgi:hypothetical protein